MGSSLEKRTMRVPSQGRDRVSSTRGPGGWRSQRRLASRAQRVGTRSTALVAGTDRFASRALRVGNRSGARCSTLDSIITKSQFFAPGYVRERSHLFANTQSIQFEVT